MKTGKHIHQRTLMSLLLGLGGSVILPAQAESTGTEAQALPNLQDELMESRSTRQSNLMGSDIPTVQDILPAATPAVPPAANQPAAPANKTPASNPVAEAMGREELRLWQWMRLAEYDKVEKRIAELKADYPQWNPPAKMVELLADQRNRKQLERAKVTSNWGVIKTMAQEQPGFFNCEKYYNLWSLADAYDASGDKAAVKGVYDTIMNTCSSDSVRVDTYRRAQLQLDAATIRGMLEREQQRSSNRMSKKSLAALEQDMTRSEVLAAAREGNDAIVLASIPDLQKQVTADQDAGLALIFGWAEYRANNVVEAERWFRQANQWKPSSDSIQAMATLYSGTGRLDEAESLARTDLRDPLMREMLAGILSQRALKAFNSEQYEDTLRYFDEAEQYAPRSLDNEAVYGWSAYHLGQYDKSSVAFEKAYKDDPQPEVAEGLYYSLKETDMSRLQRTAREEQGPLKEILETRASEEAYEAGEYHAAYAQAPEKYPGLSGINSPSLLGGLLFHFRSGDSGLSQLDTQRVPILAVEGGYSRHRASLELSGVSLSAGNMSDSEVVGSYPGLDQSYQFEPTTELNNGTEVLFGYRYDGRIAPYLHFGQTPSKGALSARTQGDLGLDYRMNRGSLKLEMFRRPVKESILSYTGAYDPYSGVAWGGADAAGYLASTYLNLRDDMGLSVAIKNASYSGTKVADNKSLEFSAGAKKMWKTDSWDELSIGPNFTFQRFEENLSKFTLGHGGYFSPQQLFKYGGTASAVSNELGDFVVAGKLDLGFQQHKQNCAPLLPMSTTNCSELYLESTGSGMYMGMELLGMVQADTNAQIGGGMFYGMSPEFNEFGFMLAFRLTMEKRKSVLRADLPDWITRVHQ